MNETIEGIVYDISREVDEEMRNGKYTRFVFTKLKIVSTNPKAMLYREIAYIGQIDEDVLGKRVEIYQKKGSNFISQKLIVYENRLSKKILKEYPKKTFRIILPGT